LLLEELGIEVVGYSLPPEADSLYFRIGREGKVLEEYADVRDLNSVQNFISRTKPVAIIHLAAQPLVIESYKSPRETFETNVLGTVNMLDAAFQASQIKAFIAITTDKVYKNDNRGIAFKESDALSGKDPYSASKVGSEAAIAAWQQIAKSVGGPKVVATRAGNVIGGGDWAKDRLIPDLIRGFSREEVVQVRNPNSTRPWQHVLDPLIGYLLTLEEVLKGETIEAINFGPRESSLAVNEVVGIVKKIWGESAIVKMETSSDSIYEASRLELDSLLAKELLNWEPVWDQKGAIQATTEWWKGLFLENKKASDLCLGDIQFALNRYSL
jgi:CDP-glucose 4,6-dehydratase